MKRYIDADKLIHRLEDTNITPVPQWIKAEIINAPTADVRENVRGEWLHKKTTDDYHVTGQCSNCHERRRIDNFCPNCGADMRGEQE